MLASGVLQSDLVIHIHIPACSAGDPGSIPGLERSPGEGNSNPLQYSCLENPMERGAWGLWFMESQESDMT